MNDLNSSQKPAVRMRSGSLLTLFLLAGLPALVTPLRADNPPTYLGQIDGSTVPGGIFAGLEPIGVAIDTSNNLYVVDTYNDRIIKFTIGGNYLTQWGSPGTGNGQLENPYSIAVDSSNNVYVADYDVDYANYFVKKFDANGHYLTQWGSIGSGNGQFGSSIGGIAVDGSQNVYVTDTGNCRVEKFTSNGAYLTQWGTNGTGNGQFGDQYGGLGPTGVAVDNSGYVYVGDAYGNRVEKFDGNGNYLGQWSCDVDGGSGVQPGEIAASSNGSIYVCGSLVSMLRFTTDGAYLTGWGVYGSVVSENLEDVAVDNTGNYIYVADSFNYRIQVFANNPNIIAPFFTSQPTNQTVPAGANVTFDPVIAGGAPFSYQWSSNSAALPGATNATLTLTNVTLSDSGNYGLLVTNRFGSNSNSIAVLTVVPSIAITQPASSLSATGAVLNGQVTVGQDTVVWFNWGVDTNYGNITAKSIVPGGSGTTNVNAALNGITANRYHYQIVATNISGIVYGDDQSFTVGSAPRIITTFTPVTSANGVALSASVNPEGWDTTVYFRWGVPNGPLSNSTPVMDIGSGAAPLMVSHVISDLAPAKQYYYQVVASNYLGTVSAAQVAFYSFPFVGVPYENWDSVASSADGSVLVAVANVAGGASLAGPILISTNSGATWAIATGAPTNGMWETVACSADGSKMIAAGGGGDRFVFPIYTSPDMGVTWVSNNAPVINWQSVASSADGTRLVAAAELNQVIYTSTNSGVVWTHATNAPKFVDWFSVALSADGTKLAGVANGSTNIFTSPDFGATWITNNVPAGPQGIQHNWSSIASSADGSRLVAAAGGNGGSGFIFISTNSGAAWKLTATNIPSGLIAHPWIYVASSADGSKLAAVSDPNGAPFGVVISSTNSGAAWTTNAVPSLFWNAVALSADGAKLVATVGYPSAGPIYVSQTTPAPVLNLSAPDNVISWIIPSLDFTLQQSSDFLNWTAVTNTPVLNHTNLENQVALPAPVGNSFFRLKH